MAEIHSQLLHDCRVAGRFPLCHLLVMIDRQYPWCILVPDREHVTEIHQLAEVDQQQLMRESSFLSTVMEAVFRPDKMNVAALGNVVSQLHIHHIARYRTDAAWPAPVWGKFPAQPYAPDELEAMADRLTGKLEQGLDFVRA